MKNILISLTVLLLPVIINAQNKSPFSAREIKDVRVATPGLFAKSNHLYLHLDSLQEHEYAFPLPGGKVISAYGTRGGHSGADIKTCAKDTIRAAFDGIVRMSNPYYAYGNLVVIRHPNGLQEPRPKRRYRKSRTACRTDGTYRSCHDGASTLRNPYQRTALQPEPYLRYEGKDLA